MYRPSIIGLSAFATASRKEMANVIDAFRKEGIKGTLFIVGGAAVNNEVFRGYMLDRLGSFLAEEEIKKIDMKISQKCRKDSPATVSLVQSNGISGKTS